MPNSDLDIVTCEMTSIKCGLIDRSVRGWRDITIFSDCRPTVTRIDGLRFDNGILIHRMP